MEAMTVIDTEVRTCPECEHPSIVKPSRHLIRRLLGLRIPVARCPEPVFDVSGWGSMPCDCQHPAHGA